MRLQSDFNFNGVPRLSYGWENPNHAAAVLICGVAIAWCFSEFEISHIKQNRLRFCFCSSLEILLTVLVVLTYSRGGLLGWAIGFVAMSLRILICTNSRPLRFRGLLVFAVPRLFLITILLFTTGFYRRFGDAISGDASVLNRLSLWSGGLRLLAARPWGCGGGQSGLEYMLWIQPYNDTTVHGGMTNSYLAIAVEHGLLAFAFMAFLLSFLLLAGVIKSRHSQQWSDRVRWACSAGILAFEAAAFTTTLFNKGAVLWAPTLLAAVLLSRLSADFSLQTIKKILSVSVLVSILTTFGVWAGALIAQRLAPESFLLANDGAIILGTTKDSPLSSKVTIFPDFTVLSANYGKVLRNALSASGSSAVQLYVYPPGLHPTTNITGQVFVAGDRLSEVSPYARGRLCLICPTVTPKSYDAIDIVLIPEYDELGRDLLWRKLCKQHSVPYYVVYESGRDISRQFPNLLLILLRSSHE